MGEKEKREVSPVGLGIKTGFYTLVWNWFCLFIPAFAIQMLGFEHESTLYELVMVIFKILAGIFGVKLALKASLSSSKVSTIKQINKAAIISAITMSIVAFVLVIIIPVMPIAPFNNLIGVIIMSIVYFFSNMHYRKMY